MRYMHMHMHMHMHSTHTRRRHRYSSRGHTLGRASPNTILKATAVSSMVRQTPSRSPSAVISMPKLVKQMAVMTCGQSAPEFQSRQEWSSAFGVYGGTHYEARSLVVRTAFTPTTFCM